MCDINHCTDMYPQWTKLSISYNSILTYLNSLKCQWFSDVRMVGWQMGGPPIRKAYTVEHLMRDRPNIFKPAPFHHPFKLLPTEMYIN